MADLTISTQDGDFGGYLALPATTPAPAVLVIQEIFGVNQVMRDICDWLASEGFVAFCPDLFWRIEPGIDITDKSDAEMARAFELFGLFDVDKGVADLKATISTLRDHPATNGKVGSVGYCLGGKMAYLMATRTDIDASVGYYGVGLADLTDEASAIKNPLLLHVATDDEFVPAEAQAAVAAALADNSHVTLQNYEGLGHAFARVGGAHFDQGSADLANGRSLDLFRQTLN
ncbi:dienelactone hydrolase family protein [Rhodovibrionaceae bacterium A322]